MSRYHSCDLLGTISILRGGNGSSCYNFTEFGAFIKRRMERRSTWIRKRHQTLRSTRSLNNFHSPLEAHPPSVGHKNKGRPKEVHGWWPVPTSGFNLTPYLTLLPAPEIKEKQEQDILAPRECPQPKSRLVLRRYVAPTHGTLDIGTSALWVPCAYGI